MKLPKLSREQYYALSFTWGIIITLIGCIMAAGLLILGERPEKNRLGWVFKVEWVKGAGVSFGPFAVTPQKPSEYLLKHEFGHSIQNCFLGPFMVILVAIPSIVRFWYREFLHKENGVPYNKMPAYDSVWFEGTATELGGQY